LPCYKLGIRFQMDDMVKRFLASGRSGFYVAVAREGEVAAGDEMKSLAQDSNAVPVSVITQLYIAKQYSSEDLQMVERALRVAALPESWKEYFRERLEQAIV
jgi:MOSC domain-containing protein YiiM